MKTRLIIKGAHYFDREAKTILIAHFTGEFVIVDCTEFILKEELTQRYDESYINENEENYIEFEGDIYYYAQSSQFNIGEWELLSDLTELQHTEEEYY